ncbi:SGNH/GDSL hydrolase family protein [Hwangdonia seohaensis]|uniref:SGNH/GDSL hydrolase family protein n=1 Tax=Hwangdonia seohaensis TaxID=1240727 RepID=A0ABW3RCD2_9FLAO|nr:SGNH/GDSL hydrolase family protein [Hwangdonia seohaensis]
MLNKGVLLLLCCLILGCVNQTDKENGITINENTEWTRSWIVNTNDSKLPKVLIVGDSHVERYYGIVASNLESYASCSKFTTSKSLGDPIFIEQLELVLKQYTFDVISFNNGLHGEDYPIEAYSKYVPIAYNLLNKNAKKSVIWVNSTAIRDKNNLNEFAPRNKQIIERNKYLTNFTKENNIPLIDFYSNTAHNLNYYTNDGVHFNNEGVKIEATLITQEIAKKLNLNLE